MTTPDTLLRQRIDKTCEVTGIALERLCERTPDALARLFQQRSQARLIRFEEQVVPGAQLTDLDPFLLRPLLRDEDGAPEQQLRRLHLLIEQDGRLCPTVAGVLLGTIEPQRWMRNAEIIAVAYTGLDNDADDQIDAKTIGGPIDRQVWDALHFVRRNMRTPARKPLGRIDYPQYSLHSPGALPNTMSIETMAAMSLPRNDVLCSLFARYYPVQEMGLGRTTLVDRRGMGVDVTLGESEKLSGRRPVYENLGDMELKLTIWAAAAPG